MSFRIHLIAPPNVQTTRAYSLDGFCMATIRFARVLKLLGYHVTLYGSEENEAPCDELVKVVTKSEQRDHFGDSPYQHAAHHENANKFWHLANQRTIAAIQERKQPRDFICLIGGVAQETIAKAHPDLMTVEWSIGYIASFAKYRVFESNYWRANTYGRQGLMDGRFFDATIPLCFDSSEFRFRGNSEKEPFALYVGRLVPKKGIGIACKAAAKAGVPLKVIGHGDTSLITDGAEYLGSLGLEERNEWMSRSSVLLAPTIYIEPFGSVAVEAQMCGTPVVATDFGGFVETVEHGVTGYRCNYLGEFVEAIKNAPALDCLTIRHRALAKWDIPAVAVEYGRYFNRLNLLWGDGWDTPTCPPSTL